MSTQEDKIVVGGAEPEDSAAGDFLFLMEKQMEARTKWQKTHKNMTATPKSRRTRELLNKLLNQVESMWAVFEFDDARLREFAEFEQSNYNTENWFKEVEGIKDDLGKCLRDQLDQIEIENGKRFSSEFVSKSSVRRIFMNLLTEQIESYEEELADLFGDDDYRAELITKYFSSFVKYNDEVIEISADRDTRQQLEAEVLEITDRVQRYFKHLNTHHPRKSPAPTQVIKDPIIMEVEGAPLTGNRNPEEIQLSDESLVLQIPCGLINENYQVIYAGDVSPKVTNEFMIASLYDEERSLRVPVLASNMQPPILPVCCAHQQHSEISSVEQEAKEHLIAPSRENGKSIDQLPFEEDEDGLGTSRFPGVVQRYQTAADGYSKSGQSDYFSPPLPPHHGFQPLLALKMFLHLIEALASTGGVPFPKLAQYSCCVGGSRPPGTTVDSREWLNF